MPRPFIISTSAARRGAPCTACSPTSERQGAGHGPAHVRPEDTGGHPVGPGGTAARDAHRLVLKTGETLIDPAAPLLILVSNVAPLVRRASPTPSPHGPGSPRKGEQGLPRRRQSRRRG